MKNWIKKQKNEIIKQTNKKINNSQIGILAININFDGISSFITEISLNKIYIIEILNQESNIIVDFPESEILMNKFVLDYRFPVKYLRKYSK